MENILVILVDQWPAWAFSHRGARVATPNVDRLAKQGTVFTNAFTSCPLCGPARAALMTSRWAHQTGVWDNIGGGYALQKPLPEEEITWIDEAVRRGFYVGYFGKWHLGEDGPIKRGAHEHDPKVEPRLKPYDPATSDFSYANCKARAQREAARRLLRGQPFFWGEIREEKEDTPAFRVMSRGVRFLENYVRMGIDRPFLLTVSSNPPHFPHYLPAEYARIADRMEVDLPPNLKEDFDDKPWWHSKPWWPCMETEHLTEREWRQVIAYSLAHIMMVDEAIGALLDALDRFGLDRNTVALFLSDHGDMQGAHNRFDKGPYFYEEVWRIPLIISHPEMPPRAQDAFVSILDVGATIFDLIGAEPNPDRPRAGRSLLPLLGRSTRPSGWRQIAFGQYELYNGMSFVIRAIRDERFKYVWNPQDVDELYDLEDDPWELRNRAGDPEFAGEKERLRSSLLAWLRESGDDLLERLDGLPPAGTIIATGKPGP